MKRLKDWRSRFEREVDAITRTPFAWGTHDCGPGLAGRLVLALTGEDVAAPFRGRYADAMGAMKVMRAAGFSDLADLVGSLLPEVHPSRARIGDLAAFPDGGAFGSALGVVNGERVFVVSESGLATRDLLDAHRAFKVG